MKNIVLIGMPGAGKSTVGVILAKTLKMNFIDTDILIQDNEKCLLQNIIDQKGIEGFIRVEEMNILSLDCNNTVIATGGSVVYSVGAMEHLKENGTIIYLKLSLDEITKRINNIKTRGIVIGKGQALSDVYKQREPLYNKYADIIINCKGSRIEDIIQKIISGIP